MSVTARLEFKLEAHERLDSGDLRSLPIKHELSGSMTFADGTDNDEIDIIWTDQRTLGIGANEVLDLSGALTDTFGASIVGVEAVFLVVKVITASGSVDVGPDSTAGWVGPFNAATDRVECGYLYGMPGLFIGKAAGWAIGAGATDELYVLNNSGAATVTYQVGLGIRSA